LLQQRVGTRRAEDAGQDETGAVPFMRCRSSAYCHIFILQCHERHTVPSAARPPQQAAGVAERSIPTPLRAAPNAHQRMLIATAQHLLRPPMVLGSNHSMLYAPVQLVAPPAPLHAALFRHIIGITLRRHRLPCTPVHMQSADGAQCSTAHRPAQETLHEHSLPRFTTTLLCALQPPTSVQGTCN
jgi:hypothetical protein